MKQGRFTQQAGRAVYQILKDPRLHKTAGEAQALQFFFEYEGDAEKAREVRQISDAVGSCFKARLFPF